MAFEPFQLPSGISIALNRCTCRCWESPVSNWSYVNANRNALFLRRERLSLCYWLSAEVTYFILQSNANQLLPKFPSERYTGGRFVREVKRVSIFSTSRRGKQNLKRKHEKARQNCAWNIVHRCECFYSKHPAKICK